MRKLELYKRYNRGEIHGIFSPQSKFTPGAGTWGLQGFAEIEDSNDFVFFVTLGTIQSGHAFDEGFTEDGVFRWQSQPRNTLKTKKIIRLINHDETENTISLFMRENKKEDYFFLGNLKYLNHDKDSGKDNQPVNFNWQMLSWPIEKNVISQLDLKFEKGLSFENKSEIKKKGLEISSPPEKKIKKRQGSNKKTFQSDKVYNNPENDKKLKEIGDEGELLVIEFEKKKLSKANKPHLIDKIKHVSKTNDSAGYDILSFNEKGDQIFIEVKSTKGPKSSDFYISPGEVKRSKLIKNYFLYRVFNLDIKNKTGNLYIRKGKIEDNFNLKPTGYKASI